MRAQIKSMMSPDVELDTFKPVDPGDVSVFIQLIVGPADEPGDESFGVEVVTPGALARRVRRQGPLVGRHLLIVDRWNLDEIRTFLESLFQREQAPNWNELGNRLARYGYWEFEDYQP